MAAPPAVPGRPKRVQEPVDYAALTMHKKSKLSELSEPAAPEAASLGSPARERPDDPALQATQKKQIPVALGRLCDAVYSLFGEEVDRMHRASWGSLTVDYREGLFAKALQCQLSQTDRGGNGSKVQALSQLRDDKGHLTWAQGQWEKALQRAVQQQGKEQVRARGDFRDMSACVPGLQVQERVRGDFRDTSACAQVQVGPQEGPPALQPEAAGALQNPHLPGSGSARGGAAARIAASQVFTYQKGQRTIFTDVHAAAISVILDEHHLNDELLRADNFPDAGSLMVNLKKLASKLLPLLPDGLIRQQLCDKDRLSLKLKGMREARLERRNIDAMPDVCFACLVNPASMQASLLPKNAIPDIHTQCFRLAMQLGVWTLLD